MSLPVSNQNQVRLETASVACCGTPAGSVSMDVDVLRCRSDVNTPTCYEYSVEPSMPSGYKRLTMWETQHDTWQCIVSTTMITCIFVWLTQRPMASWQQSWLRKYKNYSSGSSWDFGGEWLPPF